MAGDRALSLLIDIKARDSARGVIGLLVGSFKGIQNALGNLVFGFKNLGTAGTIGMDAIKAGVSGLLASLALIVVALAAVAAVVGVAIGVMAVKAAANFQQGLNRLVTGAGDVTDNMTKMGQAIIGISTDTGVLTGQLLPAMYQIISAGQRGAQAQDTLAVAAKGSVIEQAKIVDVAAAMSTMTNSGIPAARAATSLRFLFQSLENPTKKAGDAMKMWGLNSIALANEMKKSLPGALQMVYNAAKKAG